ncbi:MAG TPA: hypothetical protein PK843_15730 [bacterium]|nr:hypothetical protein [bacterium]HPN35965.1 hypothetical protein [bacterium]
MYRLICRPAIVVPFLSVLPLALIAVLGLQHQVHFSRMTRDVAAIARIHPLSGFLSSLGILLWWTSATLWLFSASVYRSLHLHKLFRFAIATGSLSTYFALDDLFQLHESIAPNYLGIPEKWVFTILAMGTILYLVLCRQQLLKKNGTWMLLSVALLGASLMMDALLETQLTQLGQWSYLLEDGCKWLGIVCWCCFCLITCRCGMMALIRK